MSQSARVLRKRENLSGLGLWPDCFGQISIRFVCAFSMQNPGDLSFLGIPAKRSHRTSCAFLTILAPRHVDRTLGPVGRGAQAAGTAVPIMLSRLTISANCSASHPSVADGRAGSTRYRMSAVESWTRT